MKSDKKVIIKNANWCKQCGICIHVCPVNVLAFRDGVISIVNIKNCIGCKNCELSCPDYVLEVVKSSE